MSQIKTMSLSSESGFEEAVNALLAQGYRILSTSCGFVNSESYGFCDSWQAILIKETAESEV